MQIPVLNTPNVYIQEISVFPPSVAEVSTAVPAFIGYTQLANPAGKNVPTRISSFLEYKNIFGYALAQTIAVTVDANNNVTSINAGELLFNMYYSLQMYFANGGGPCYIVSVGLYYTIDPTTKKPTTTLTTKAEADLSSGLDALKQVDEPTIIVAPDAVNLSSTDFANFCQSTLQHCATLNRFAICDIQDYVQGTDPVTNFRNDIGTNNLAYGAAYTPFLLTALPYYIDDQNSSISVTQDLLQYKDSSSTLTINYTGSTPPLPSVSITIPTPDPPTITFDVSGSALTITAKSTSKSSDVANAWIAFTKTNPSSAINFQITYTTSNPVSSVSSSTAFVSVTNSLNMQTLSTTNTTMYNNILSAINAAVVPLPPSGAIAGIYCTVDSNRGVWKAPANVSINAVIGPKTNITNDEQADLNIDPSNNGKSINAIRSFTGKGTLVWGSRTLAGNDNNWRYIPVRRLLSIIELSLQNATAFAIFEPNTAMTWLKVRTMTESFLEGLWKQGALAGSKPEQAFFVNVGLGTTMTANDILNGVMIIEVGVAAAHPAEFIILRISQMLQQS
jgi:phage tail sheath protein FI